VGAALHGYVFRTPSAQGSNSITFQLAAGPLGYEIGLMATDPLPVNPLRTSFDCQINYREANLNASSRGIVHTLEAQLGLEAPCNIHIPFDIIKTVFT
jgi:hypothetical protein